MSKQKPSISQKPVAVPKMNPDKRPKPNGNGMPKYENPPPPPPKK